MESIKKTIKEFDMPPGGDEGINAGSCDRFAHEVIKQIPGAKMLSDFDFKELADDDASEDGGATLSVYDYSKKVPPNFHFPLFGHCWIYYNGKVSYEVQDLKEERKEILATKYFS